MVPMVTASEGRPSRVTSRPLSAPQAAPTRTTTGRMVSSGQPAVHSQPISALDSPSTEATDRSISAAAMTSVSGSAIRAISAMSNPR